VRDGSSLLREPRIDPRTQTHFPAEYAELVRRLKTIPAQRVVLCTVPHVTIAPIARGVNPAKPGEKWQPGSRFFPYYTDPWIDDTHFRTDKHRYITHQQERAIDSAIDQYTTRSPTWSGPAGVRVAAGSCSTCAACSTRWPIGVTAMTRLPPSGTIGSPRFFLNPSKVSTPGSSSRPQRDASRAACSV
jgi:hypothetical protein